MDLAMVNNYEDWIELYKKLIYWELELENINDSGMLSILESQKEEANNQFFKFIKNNYQDFFLTPSESFVESIINKPLISRVEGEVAWRGRGYRWGLCTSALL